MISVVCIMHGCCVVKHQHAHAKLGGSGVKPSATWICTW